MAAEWVVHCLQSQAIFIRVAEQSHRVYAACICKVILRDLVDYFAVFQIRYLKEVQKRGSVWVIRENINVGLVVLKDIHVLVIEGGVWRISWDYHASSLLELVEALHCEDGELIRAVKHNDRGVYHISVYRTVELILKLPVEGNRQIKTIRFNINGHNVRAANVVNNVPLEYLLDYVRNYSVLLVPNQQRDFHDGIFVKVIEEVAHQLRNILWGFGMYLIHQYLLEVHVLLVFVFFALLLTFLDWNENIFGVLRILEVNWSSDHLRLAGERLDIQLDVLVTSVQHRCVREAVCAVCSHVFYVCDYPVWYGVPGVEGSRVRGLGDIDDAVVLLPAQLEGHL